MGSTTVQALFCKAMAEDDAAAMREGLERMLGVADGQGLSADAEYALRSPDFVMEMPQSGVLEGQLDYGQGRGASWS